MVSLNEEYSKTSLGWQQSHLKIVDKLGHLTLLNHNIAQLKVHNAIQLQRAAGLPIMLCILKARQEGISTFIEAYIFEQINRKANRHGCVASADQDATDKVFRMCDTYQQEMPATVKLKTEAANAKEIRYAAPHRSSMLCQTAGKKVLGRGGTTHYVHATEVAFWENADIQLLGLLQEVPDNEDTMIVLESTANGVGGAFYDIYWKAVRRLKNNPNDYAGYLPIFLPWQIFPEYETELPAEGLIVPKNIQAYFDEQPDIVLSDKQKYWAMLKIQNKCGGDIGKFKQEFPRTAREAFQSSGRQVFNQAKVDEIAKKCIKPMAHLDFYMDGDTVKYNYVNKSENCWSVFKPLNESHNYIVFGDVAEGILSNRSNPKSEPDRSVCIVLDRTMFEIAAVYYGRPDTIEYGDQMLMAAKFYNNAWASPEINSIGQSVLDVFKRDGYQYIYQREHREETDNTEDSSNLGWKTTTKTRKPMVADLCTVINEAEIGINDERIIDEIRVFIYNAQGKPEAETGEHDDTVMALAGAIQLHLRCPLNPMTYSASHTGVSTKQSRHTSLAIAGAVDDESDMFSDGEDL